MKSMLLGAFIQPNASVQAAIRSCSVASTPGFSCTQEQVDHVQVRHPLGCARRKFIAPGPKFTCTATLANVAVGVLLREKLAEAALPNGAVNRRRRGKPVGRMADDEEASAGEVTGYGPVNRREFLILGGGVLMSVRELLESIGLVPNLGLALPPALSGSFTRSVHRRDDFLAVTFDFRNLRLTNGTPRRLVKRQANQPAYMIVQFPPQHVADQAFLETDQFAAPGDVQTRLAGPSRLAFEIPGAQLPLTFDLDTLLSWTRYQPRLVPVAGAPPSLNASIREPTSSETALELPWFLLLSPLPTGGWAHALDPVTHDQRTEIWHTRLGARKFLFVDESDAAGRRVQAVWNRDLPKTPDHDPAEGPRWSLEPVDRREIVQLTSNRTEAKRRPIDVNRLMLSSLGGWLDVHGEWEPSGYSLESWVHRATMGRDSYVKVVHRGFLFPYGHRAAKLAITERKFRADANGKQRAYLHQRVFVVVRQPERVYGGLGHASQGRGFPFRSVRIRNLTTPNITPPGEHVRIFVPKLEGTQTPVLFDLVGADWSGREVEFSQPLTFVPSDASQIELGDLVSVYNNRPPDHEETQKKQRIKGQKVAFAEENERGDTSFDVNHLVIAAEHTLANAAQQLQNLDEAKFFPRLTEAGLRLPAAEQLLGKELGEVLMQLDPGFVTDGFHAVKNAGEVFLKMLDGESDTIISFIDQAEKAGALATPDLSISGITRQLGPVGGLLDELRAGKFDPATFLNQGAKLLGATKLLDILDSVPLLQGGPRIQTVLEPKAPALPVRSVTTLVWTPKLRDGDPLHIFKPIPTSTMSLNARVVAEFADPAKSTFEIKGDLRDFQLQLIGASPFMVLHVKKMAFTVVPDKKPDFDFELGDIEFKGVLQFVEELRNFLSSLGSGLAVDVSPNGIEASLSLPLPRIAVGVFTMQNMSLGVGAVIPFNGDAARFRFNFCTRENPFILTVSMFGGGGFFGLECGTDKSVMLEVALEFGASVAFDIGVASGGVEVMAGIYIKVESPPGEASLTGYLRMGGELDILGIISIVCELYLGFTYVFPPVDKCIGRASFYLEIEIFIFSFSVSAEVERRFGGESDPTFAQFMAPTDWSEYADAYAPIGAA